ncbi:superoxide dismutase, Fe-Mn family [Gracilimonas mengyeensis]|uniref:Superoxide dismutase n=2 Tax=Gracilimonas mengyeensis TaxID=1302730 RepID=A0A521B1I1_9BACT|nr:superoxide dismutase, Fe-Mn family [Gracilimonas mengyeensis]
MSGESKPIKHIMSYELPELSFEYDALKPSIDAKTMEIHHTKHHQGYTNKFNNAIEGTDLEDQDIEEIFSSVSKHSTAVRNNGGGFYNHSLFWSILAPNAGGSPDGELAEAIDKAFGSFDAFKEEFASAAGSRFGSGWAWLIVNADGELEITSTPNQDNPLMDVADVQGTPILGLDVWEHAYYLNYQNRRPDYISSFWNVVNWDKVAEYYNEAK